jgi:hypothetical protein
MTRSDPLILALLASQRVLMDALYLAADDAILTARIREIGMDITRAIAMRVKSQPQQEARQA